MLIVLNFPESSLCRKFYPAKQITHSTKRKNKNATPRLIVVACSYDVDSFVIGRIVQAAVICCFSILFYIF